MTSGAGASGGPGGASAGSGAGGGAGGAVVGPAPTGGRSSSASASAAACSQPLKIGVDYSGDEGAGLAAVGHPSAGFTQYAQSLQQGWQIGIDYLNSHGGLAGCKVSLYAHDMPSLAADGFSGESQKECTDFAQDQHVFVAVPGLSGSLQNKVLITCLAQAHIPVFWNGIAYSPSEADFSAYRGYLYEIGIAYERFGPFLPALAQAGYFGTGAKVGILLADDGSGDNQHLVNDIWLPQLKAMNIPTSVFTYSEVESFSDAGDASSQFQSAVLQFKTAGVNHVLITPDGGDADIFFTAAAEGQNFHPRYGMTTDSTPPGMADAPSDQAAGAMAVSWSVGDFINTAGGNSLPPGISSNSMRTLCAQLYSGYAAAQGEPVSNFYGWCDTLVLLQLALGHAPSPTPAALLSGIESLGTTFVPAETYGTSRFGPGRYDGATSVRVLLWSNQSGGWVFASGPESVS
jgi:hypothetical protein